MDREAVSATTEAVGAPVIIAGLFNIAIQMAHIVRMLTGKERSLNFQELDHE